MKSEFRDRGRTRTAANKPHCVRCVLTLGQPQAVRCPNCGYLIENWNAIIPIMDACGFESYSLRCEECEERLGGIIDAEDGQLLLVKLEGSIWSSSP